MSHEPAFHTLLLQSITHAWLLHAVTAAIKLRIPDALSERPQTSAELAERLHLHEPTLARLLRALVNNRFVRQHQGGYVLTEAGEDLRSDRSNSLVPLALLEANDIQRRAWDALDKSLLDGASGLEHAVGQSLPAYLAQHADAAQVFHRAVQALGSSTLDAVAKHRDLSQVGTCVDMGGGSGALAVALLKRHPNLRGTVFDTPSLRSNADRTLQQAGLAERCTFLAGDLFETAPPRADLYVCKTLLTRWNDARSLQILQKIRSAMPPRASVWIVEPLMAPETDTWASVLDLQMLALTGGRVRSQADYQALLQRVGLGIQQVRLVADTHVLVAQALP